jgi:hypothetical protein
MLKTILTAAMLFAATAASACSDWGCTADGFITGNNRPMARPGYITAGRYAVFNPDALRLIEYGKAHNITVITVRFNDKPVAVMLKGTTRKIALYGTMQTDSPFWPSWAVDGYPSQNSWENRDGCHSGPC